MQLPDVPYMPLRLEKERDGLESNFFKFLETTMEHILIGRQEKKLFSVLGYNGRKMNFLPSEPYVEERDVQEYVQVDWRQQGKRHDITVQRSKGVYLDDTGIILTLLTGGIYGLVRTYSSSQKERERRQQNFYRRAKEYLDKNKSDLQTIVDAIPIYVGPMADVEQRVGRSWMGLRWKERSSF